MSEAKIKNASVALVAVRIWIKAMITYHDVLKIVNPNRKIASEKTIQLELVMGELNKKIAEVKAIDEKLDALNEDKTALETKAQNLKDELEECGLKLIRAEKMIGGLSGEKDRWTAIVADLTV